MAQAQGGMSANGPQPLSTEGGRVLIPLPGIGTLALDAKTYWAALAEGERLGAAAHAADPVEPLLDPEGLAVALSLPVSWIEQAAREGRIPSIQFGRFRRFRRSEVESAMR